MPARQLSELFCERFRCAPSEYERKAFRKCLYLHARLAAPLIRKLRPDYFYEDFKFLEYLGASTSFREANDDVRDFGDVNQGTHAFSRKELKFRVSGRKANRLAYELFSKASQPSP